MATILQLGLVQKLGRVRADVAEALDGDARLLRLAAQAAEQLDGQDADAAAGRFLAAGDAVQLDRLAGDARPG